MKNLRIAPAIGVAMMLGIAWPGAASAETVFAIDADHVRAYDTTTRPAAATLEIGNSDLGTAGSVAVDTTGNIYVFDQGTLSKQSIIQKFDSTGAYVGVWNGASGLKLPQKMLFGPNGDLYVVDDGANPVGVYRFDGATGEAKGVFTTGITLGTPFGIAFDDGGSLYVSDAANLTTRILRYDPTGAYQATVLHNRVDVPADLINFPRGLCWGYDDWLYIVDHFDEVIYRYDPVGLKIEKFAEIPNSSPQDCVASPTTYAIYVDVFGPNGIIPIDKVPPDFTAGVGTRFATDLPGHRVLALSSVTLGEATTTTTTSTTTTTELPGVCGDASGDGKVTTGDALRILQAAVAFTKCPALICDTDHNGSVTTADALRVLKKAVGQVIALICS